MRVCAVRFLPVVLAAVLLMMPGGRASAAEPVKVAVIPSVLNMFIQYSVLTDILDEEDYLFEKTARVLRRSIESQDGFAYSSKTFGTDDKTASIFMLSGPYPNSRDAYDADVIVLVGNTEDRRMIEVFMVGVESGRAVSSFIDARNVTNANFAGLLKEKILSGLSQSDRLLKVNAEEVVDPRNSVVQYRLHSRFKDDLLINVDFDNGHEMVENMEIAIANDKEDGVYDYEYLTLEGVTLKVKCTVEDNDIVDVRFDVDFRPEDPGANGPDMFTVLSRDGYPLNFHFFWENGEVERVSLFPQDNPFYPHVLPDIP